MTGYVLAAIAAAYVLIALNLLLTFAVIRKLREKPAPTSQTSGEVGISLPGAGTRMGSFDLITAAGDRIDDRQLAEGGQALLLLTPRCSPCKEAARKLTANPQWWSSNLMVVVGGDEDDPLVRELTAALPSGVRTVLDPAGLIGGALEVTGYPAAILLDDGVVVKADHRIDQVLPRSLSLATSTR